ncbi:MAG: MerR family transcriptional regulator [Lachnospiraceae bacterium]
MYKINELAKLSGVSTRTLRYYHEIELLVPEKIDDNGYRIYDQIQIDQLHQILFYRELDFSLEDIKDILYDADFNLAQALELHLTSLLQKKERIDQLIKNVTNTIRCEKGEFTMTNEEKFEGFKKEIILNNEESYGLELRKKFGDETINGSYEKINGMSREQWEHAQELNLQINEKLLEAFKQADPTSEVAHELCKLHKEWLCMFWKEGTYSRQAHIGLAKCYVLDDRFRSYFDKIAVGSSDFLYDAIKSYCSNF